MEHPPIIINNLLADRPIDLRKTLTLYNDFLGKNYFFANLLIATIV